jgi:hypothetical protein
MKEENKVSAAHTKTRTTNQLDNVEQLLARTAVGDEDLVEYVTSLSDDDKFFLIYGLAIAARTIALLQAEEQSSDAVEDDADEIIAEALTMMRE